LEKSLGKDGSLLQGQKEKRGGNTIQKDGPLTVEEWNGTMQLCPCTV